MIGPLAPYILTLLVGLLIAYALWAIISVPLSYLRDFIDHFRRGNDGLTGRERKALAAKYRRTMGCPTMTSEQRDFVREWQRRRLERS